MRKIPVDTRSAADPRDDAWALVDMPPLSSGLKGHDYSSACRSMPPAWALPFQAAIPEKRILELIAFPFADEMNSAPSLCE